MSTEQSDILYEKIIYQNDEKHYQLRLVINVFREKEYLHIRKYFLSFDEGYIPSKEGISMELSISNSYSLMDGLVEICSKLEDIDAISDHFYELLEKIDLTNATK
jgi:hypothetical protein